MRRFSIFLVALLVLTTAGCDGETGADDSGMDAAVGSDTSTNADTSTSGDTNTSGDTVTDDDGSSGADTATGMDTSMGDDGGSDAARVDTGRPGEITCGTASCRAGGQACCAEEVGPSGMPMCIGIDDRCAGSTIRCDSASDCPFDETCCSGLIAMGLQTTCAPIDECASPVGQRCDDATPCPGGDECCRVAGGDFGFCFFRCSPVLPGL